MMVYNDWRNLAIKSADRIAELERKVGDLSRENARLRQERDAANAQIYFIMEKMNEGE